ncbi:MAG: hydrogenase nickel incorporation protein HypB [bacterium]
MPSPGSGMASDDQRAVDVRQSILSKNDRLAERNRGMFMAKGIVVLNIVSSPGSGKTALIERTLQDIGKDLRIAVIVGDLATENDAKRLRRHGATAIQITTGTACHLDAHMVQHALEELDLDHLDLLLIENVGNLVCPASFDLGEDARVVVMSVTEGEDKPLKYPVIFQDAAAVLVNKSDLAVAVEFQRDAALAAVRQVAPRATILEVSARTGSGMPAWYELLKTRVATKRKPGERPLPACPAGAPGSMKTASTRP